VLASCANVRAHETFVVETHPSRGLGFFRLLMLVGSALTHGAQPQEAHCAPSSRAGAAACVKICREEVQPRAWISAATAARLALPLT
jgi:hypothetical protein